MLPSKRAFRHGRGYAVKSKYMERLDLMYSLYGYRNPKRFTGKIKDATIETMGRGPRSDEKRAYSKNNSMMKANRWNSVNVSPSNPFLHESLR